MNRIKDTRDGRKIFLVLNFPLTGRTCIMKIEIRTMIMQRKRKKADYCIIVNQAEEQLFLVQ